MTFLYYSLQYSFNI